MRAVNHILTWGCGVFLLASCASNLTAPATQSSKSSSVPASVSARDRVIAERVFGLVNGERARVGKRAMRGHNGLNKLAQNHSNQMSSVAKSANHFGSQNRAQYAYLKYSIENLSEMTYAVPAGTSDPAAAAVAAWKRSNEHSRHMLQSWDLTGIGVKSAPSGVTYVTMCLGAQPMGVPRGIQPVGWQ